MFEYKLFIYFVFQAWTPQSAFEYNFVRRREAIQFSSTAILKPFSVIQISENKTNSVSTVNFNILLQYLIIIIINFHVECMHFDSILWDLELVRLVINLYWFIHDMQCIRDQTNTVCRHPDIKVKRKTNQMNVKKIINKNF